MDDLISKRSATERLIIAKTLLESILQDMPTAEPTADLSEYCDKLWKTAYERGKAEAHPKKGKWVLTDFPDEQTYKCSACNEIWTFIDGTPEDNGAFFCPNCGARMEE